MNRHPEESNNTLLSEQREAPEKKEDNLSASGGRFIGAALTSGKRGEIVTVVSRFYPPKDYILGASVSVGDYISLRTDGKAYPFESSIDSA